VSGEPAAQREAILEEFSEQVLVGRERDHAVADVARGQDAVFAAQAAGAAAVVRHCHDGGEIGDGPVRAVRAVAPPLGNVVFKPAEHGRESRATAERDHSHRQCGTMFRMFFHGEIQEVSRPNLLARGRATR
jgi:hypothetical protein